MINGFVAKGGKTSAPIPVTVLSGFLGAGKTTVLTSLLANKGALNIGIVVNDLAEVNVDARIVQQVEAGVAIAKFAELSHGCICCSAGEDLLGAVQSLLQGDCHLDAIVVECSGVAQPANVVELFRAAEATDSRAPIVLDSVVTVVDAATLMTWLQFPVGAALQGGQVEEGQADLAQLLVEQVECADVIIVNKSDRIPYTQLTTCRSAVAALNPRAALHSARFGVVPLEAIIRTSRRASPRGSCSAKAELSKGSEQAAVTGNAFRHGQAREHAHQQADHQDCRGLLENEAMPAGSVHGLEEHAAHSHGEPAAASIVSLVSSFVFSERRPFHPERLWRLLKRLRQELTATNPDADDPRARLPAGDNLTGPPSCSGRGSSGAIMGGVLRSKGLVWLASSWPNSREWAQAGGVLELQHGAPWQGSPAGQEVPLDQQGATVGEGLQGDVGNRRQEIVFIGTGAMDKAAIVEALQACLLDSAEMAGGPESWRAFRNPIALTLTTAQRARAAAKPASHGKACPCCDPSLKDLDRLVFGGLF